MADGAEPLWSLGPSLAFTALDFGGRAAVRDAARAAYDASVADYRQTMLTAFGQVEDNLNALEVLRRESAAQRDAVDAAKRALSRVGNRYENGAITYLNVVVTQAIVLSDQRAAVRIERRRMAASVALVKALGGGVAERGGGVGAGVSFVQVQSEKQPHGRLFSYLNQTI